jgi:hypothetical protein
VPRLPLSVFRSSLFLAYFLGTLPVFCRRKA